MKSHVFQVEAVEWARLVLGPLTCLLLLSALLQLGTRTGALPAPRPARDPDQTILVHQADASRARSAASVILCGDSSCLMDVQAQLLSELLGLECRNLGTFSYLNLEAASWLLQEFDRTNPGQIKRVVVLMHPQALRQASPDPRATQFLRHYLQGLPPPPLPGLTARIQDALGLSDLRNRVLDRLLPVPLTGSFGRYYGFTADLEEFMTRHHGSALDPESRPFRGSAEYGLAQSLENTSRDFRSALSREKRLIIGITPIPDTFAPTAYASRYREMLEQWGRWIDADTMLTNLPSTLPEPLFAKTTHLNQAGMIEYTRRLAQAMRQSEPNPPDWPARPGPAGMH